jgi:putative Mg2+ transporter-C (MgtC) family protein
MHITHQFLVVIEIIIKLILSVLCGGVLQFDRGKSTQPDASISKILEMMSLGTCLLVLLWKLNFGDAVGLSMIFFASMIVFIGIISSAIIITHHGSKVGMIMAVAIWIAASIGMSIGYSLYFIAITATLIGYLSLRLVNRISEAT